MNLPFNIENVNLVLTLTFEMELLEVHHGRNHFYKKCVVSKFNMVREYWVDTYERDGYLWFERVKKIAGDTRNANKRSYKLIDENWDIFLDDMQMRTFSASDSYNVEYIIESLKGHCREKNIAELLSD